MRKKLYLSIIAILMPVLLYMCVFFINDPHGYYRKKAVMNDSLIEKMIEWKRGNYNAIIIGDSRTVWFKDKYLDELNTFSGYQYMNMAYNGAMGTEMNYLANWCINQKQGESIKSIIIVTGWYNFNELLQQNRVEATEKVLENPLTYAFCINNVLDWVNKADNISVETVKEYIPTTTDNVAKEEHLRIEKEVMARYLKKYETSRSVLDGLISLCNYCKKNGIEIKIVVPPWIKRFYVELHDFGDYDVDEYKQELSNYVDIYDMEYESCVLSEQFDDFSDYSHFHGDTYDQFANVLIYGKQEYMRQWIAGEVEY